MFITFEGIDGSGKSTLAAALAERLEECPSVRQRVVLTREPGGTAVAEGIRDLLARHAPDLSARTQSLLFSAARSALVEKVIHPWLREGAIVICDRFTDSTRVYQLPHWPNGESLVNEFQDEAPPDLTFLLDLPAEQAYQRLSDREKGDLPDPEILRLEALRRRYLDLARNNPRIQVINVAGVGIKRLTDDLLSRVLRKLGLGSQE